MSWIGDKAEATANVLKDLLMQTPAAKLYREGPQNVLAALLDTREEEWRSKIQAMPKPFDSSPEAINRDMEAAMAFWNPAGMLGKIVYHGSPHKFDKFDASKIGTGEGAQAYGHGVYLADAEDVAKGYQKTLAYKAFDLGQEAEKRGLKLTAGARGEFHRQASANTDPMRAARGLQNANISARELPQEKLAELFDAFQKDGTGALYKADLPDEWIPKMLDWDKPLKDQGEEVRNALRAVIPNEGQTWMKGAVSPKPVTDAAEIAQLNALAKTNPSAIEEAGYYMGSPFDLMTGKDIHYMLGGKAMGSSGAGEKALREAGIPGIRYLDGGSRPNSGRITMLEQTIANLQGKGASKAAISNAQRELDAEIARASYNYVVFPGLEDKVKILERNGQPVNALAEILK